MANSNKPTIYHAKVKASLSREMSLDNYNKVTDEGESRTMGEVDITADSLDSLKKKLHAHIDLLE